MLWQGSTTRTNRTEPFLATGLNSQETAFCPITGLRGTLRANSLCANAGLLVNSSFRNHLISGWPWLFHDQLRSWEPSTTFVCLKGWELLSKKETVMPKLGLLITAFALMGGGAVCEQIPGIDSERSAMLMALEAQLDGITMFKTTFPLCHAEPGGIAESPRKTFSFSMKPKRSILWMRQLRHTVTPITTKPNQEIQVSIWTYCTDDNKHPGASSGWIAIGGSISSDDKLLRNMIHLAHPKKRDRSEIATGLAVLTYPARHGE